MQFAGGTGGIVTVNVRTHRVNRPMFTRTEMTSSGRGRGCVGACARARCVRALWRLGPDLHRCMCTPSVVCVSSASRRLISTPYRSGGALLMSHALPMKLLLPCKCSCEILPLRPPHTNPTRQSTEDSPQPSRFSSLVLLLGSCVASPRVRVIVAFVDLRV